MIRSLGLALACALALVAAAAAEPRIAALPGEQAAAAPLAPRTLPASVTAQQRERLRKAFDAARAGRWAEAHAAAAGHEIAARTLRWMELQRGGGGFEATTAFIAAHPDWPLRDTLLRRAEEASAAVADDARIRAWFGDRPPLTGAGALRLAEAHHRAGDLAAAERVARAAWRGMILAERIEKDLLKGFGGALSIEDHTARVDRLIWERRLEDVPRLLRLLDPERRLLAEARIKLARDTHDASDFVARIPKSHARDPGLLFERARYNRRNGHDDLALSIHLGAEAPLLRPDVWWRERDIVARRLLREGRAAEALALVSTLHGLEPEHGQAFADANFLAGWIALRRTGDAASARDSFARLHGAARLPVTQARGAYWLGRAHEALGDTETARGWYRQAAALNVTFYGQIALLRLPDGERPAPGGPPAPTREERAHVERSDLARAAILLADIGEHDSVKHFVRRMIDVARSPGEKRAAAQIAIGLGRPDLAVSMAKRAAQRAGVMLPDEGWPTIRTPPGNAPERALVLATIRQESAFEADAVSPAGARGLMQLMPLTARAVAEQLGQGKRHTPQRLTAEPLYNMTLGQAYLAGLLADYGNASIIALAAYNAGPGRVAQWIREHGDPRADDVDPIDWIEMIVFDETRNYVQRVSENLMIYRQKLGQRDWLAALERDFARAGK
jgi:soluble lytic murein transglycosylase